MALEPVYTPRVGQVLDQVQYDPARRKLWEAVCDAIDLVCDSPGSAETRREAVRVDRSTTAWLTPAVRVDRSTTAWLTPIQYYGDDAHWVMIWQKVGAAAVIVYLGDKDAL